MLACSVTATWGEVLPSGMIRETGQCQGTITGHVVNYSVIYPPAGVHMPVFLHQYGSEAEQTGVAGVNERVAGYGAFSVFVSLPDEHCGYDLQDYKDAIDDVFRRYAARVDARNVTIAGESYGAAEVYGMAVRFPYLFDAVIPIFGVADFGYDPTQSWYPMILQNSPGWDPVNRMNQSIGDPALYRDSRYLVRNAIFGAKNNPYAHFEILHDVDDGVGKPGVQVVQSQRYVAELGRLGYANFRYTETPKAALVYPSNAYFPSNLWGQPIRYTHGFWDTTNMSLYQFELYALKNNMINGTWKRPTFLKTGDVFVPSFLEVPYFRVDLGSVQNNCDEAADVTYDVSSPGKYCFQIVPQTELSEGTLRLLQLTPNSQYTVTCMLADTDTMLAENSLRTDAAGSLVFDIPGAARNSTLVVECVRIVPEPCAFIMLVSGLCTVSIVAVWQRPRRTKST